MCYTISYQRRHLSLETSIAEGHPILIETFHEYSSLWLALPAMDLHDKETYYGDQYKNAELTFNVEGGRSMILSIPSPKEDLTLATVKEKAALIIPVLESSSGAPVTSLKSAKIVETSATVLE